MNGTHWSNDDLLEHLYGLKSEDDHFKACPECTARARKLEDARARLAEPPDVPHELLDAQRRSIHQRLGSRVYNWHPLRWAVSAAAVGAMALGLMLFQAHEPQHPHPGDDQFYSELSSLDQTAAPRAVQAIDALVEDGSQE